ncbi:hypothetical protein [Collinsella tanakaei]|uniref:hypothetical protein n=1 Tax=Collinsella tanakaei TaxID=626935 RepID=UPI00195BD535|nr:hypothetical protein [Collinsella tanakaei]MBM6868918.1 hypothetical protein [Collinsella tanakaei]
MKLNRPYGESAEDLERAEDKQARREVAVRLVAQATDTCAMCACALDSAFMDGRPMPEGIYRENVTEAVERALLQAARDLSAVQSVL